MKRCPFCAEEIQDEAVKCRFCGERLDLPNVPSPSGGERPAKGNWRGLGRLVCLIGVVGTAYCGIVFDTSVAVPGASILGQEIPPTRVNNLGLMADRQNGILIFGLLAVIGTVLIVTSRRSARTPPAASAPRESREWTAEERRRAQRGVWIASGVVGAVLVAFLVAGWMLTPATKLDQAHEQTLRCAGQQARYSPAERDDDPALLRIDLSTATASEEDASRAALECLQVARQEFDLVVLRVRAEVHAKGGTLLSLRGSADSVTFSPGRNAFIWSKAGRELSVDTAPR